MNTKQKREFAKYLNTKIIHKYKMIIDKMYGRGKHSDILKSVLEHTNYLYDSFLTMNNYDNRFNTIDEHSFKNTYSELIDRVMDNEDIYLVSEDSTYLIDSDEGQDLIDYNYKNEEINEIIEATHQYGNFYNFITGCIGRITLKHILDKFIIITSNSGEYLIFYKKSYDNYVVIYCVDEQEGSDDEE